MVGEIVDVLSYIREEIRPDNLGKFYVNYYAKLGPGIANFLGAGEKQAAAEFHQFYEIAIQIDQSSDIQIGEDFYQLCRNQFCIISQGIYHCLQGISYSNRPAKILWISVTSEIVRTGYSIYSKDGKNKVYGTDLYIPGNFIVGEICAEQALKRRGSEEAVTSYIKAFLSLLLQKMSFSSESPGHVWMNAVVFELQRYIKERIHESLSLHDLSDYVSLSPNYLSKLFKQVTGETITAYTQNMKIARSIEYLSDPTISLSEIAAQLGFYDQFHFSKVFKAYTGLAPSRYRKAHSSHFPPLSRVGAPLDVDA